MTSLLDNFLKEGKSSPPRKRDFHPSPSRDRLPQDRIPCTISWPVLHYVNGQFALQLLFMKKDHFITIHPITSEVVTYRPLNSILRVSFDVSEHQNPADFEREELSLYKVFRVIFKRKSPAYHVNHTGGHLGSTRNAPQHSYTKNLQSARERNNDIMIFLSKDGNEIVNAIVSKMRQIKMGAGSKSEKSDDENHNSPRQKDAKKLRHEITTKDEANAFNRYDDTSSTHSSHSSSSSQSLGSIESPKNVLSPRSPRSPLSPRKKSQKRSKTKNALYKYTIHSGLYQYQVFGIGKNGHDYPHMLSLFSHFVKHVDSSSKRTFAQHIYEHIIGVDFLGQDIIQIKYAYDNPYIFKCTSHDRAELFCLLKGRVSLYQMLKANIGLDPFDDASSYSSEETERSEKKALEGDFPSSFSYEDEKIANEDPYKYDPDMLRAILELKKTKSKITVNLDEQDNDSIDLGMDGEIDLSLHLNNVQLGMEVWKAKKLAKKNSTMKIIFMRIEKDCLAKWGTKRKKLKNSIKIKEIITGSEAEFPQSKANKEFSFILKAEHSKDDMYCVARDKNEFKSWIAGIKFYLKKKEGE